MAHKTLEIPAAFAQEVLTNPAARGAEWTEAQCRLYGRRPSTIREWRLRVRIQAKAGKATEESAPVEESRSASEDVHEGDVWKTRRVSDHRIHTEAELLSFFEVDSLRWSVKRWGCRVWEMGTKMVSYTEPDKNGNVHQLFHTKATPLYSVWAEFAPNVNGRVVQGEVDALLAFAKTHMPVYAPVQRQTPKNPHMLSLSIPDLHLNKRADPDEANASYSVELARGRYKDAVDRLLQATAQYDVDKILYTAGSDFLHTDNRQGTTTRGTPQDTDRAFQEAFLAGFSLHVEVIDELRLRAPVQVIVVRGNHDAQACWHMGRNLELFYDKCPDVSVDNRSIERKYFQYGKVLLGFTHGDKAKKADYAALMPHEAKEFWAGSEFREMHTGHLHGQSMEEKFGVRVRVLSSLSEEDKWHHDNGYVGNIKAAQAFLWSGERGLVATHEYNVPG